MQLNTTPIVVLLSIGFLCVIISFIIAFKALITSITKRKHIHAQAWEDFLKRESFTHHEFTHFMHNTLQKEGTFTSLYNKFLEPLVKQGVLKYTKDSQYLGNYRRSVYTYKRP